MPFQGYIIAMVSRRLEGGNMLHHNERERRATRPNRPALIRFVGPAAYSPCLVFALLDTSVVPYETWHLHMNMHIIYICCLHFFINVNCLVFYINNLFLLDVWMVVIHLWAFPKLLSTGVNILFLSCFYQFFRVF